MKAKLIATMCTILTNVLSSTIYDCGKRALKAHQTKQFQETFQVWLDEFFSTHIEPVFETSAFYTYMEYQNPCRKIVRYFLGVDNTTVSEETFLNRLAADCRDSIIQAGDKCSIPEERTIYDLFQGVLQLCKNALMEKMPEGEALLLYGQRQINASMDEFYQNTIPQMSDMASQLQKLLALQEKITDVETIEKAYHLLSDAIWEGQLAAVQGFLPLLAGKNDDLENAIKIKLSMLSDDDLSVTNPLELCCNISNSALKDDVFRLLILHYYKEPEKLAPYVGAITDPTLRKIAVSLVDGHMEQIIIRTETKQNHTICYTCDIAEGLESEQWLTHRLCILTIAENPMYHSAETAKKLAVQPNFIDRLYIWGLSLNEYSQFFTGSEENIAVFQILATEMKAKIGCYAQTRVDLQGWFYKLLLHSMDVAGDKLFPEMLDSIPEPIADLPEIEAIRLAEYIKTGTTDQNTIIKFVFRTGQHWLLVRYCNSLNDYQKALEIIHQVEYLVSQSPDIFSFVAFAMCQTKGKSDALAFLKGYEQQYANLSMFWIMAYQFAESNEDRQLVADAIVSGIHEEKLQCRSFLEQKQLLEILLIENRLDDALGLLISIETMGFGDADTVRMKIHIYTRTDQQINALTEIGKHYDELKDDEQIIDALLSISLNYKRPITDGVLAHAKKFKNSRILMLAAQVEQTRQNLGEAEKLAMQSMLITRPEDEELFLHAFPIILDDSSPKANSPSRVTENTYFIGENQQDHSRLTFCVYRENILPHVGYQWKNAQHIDMDSAVNQGFIRLSLGDTVEIQGGQYTIIEIGSLSGFYFRVCIDSLKQQGLMWQIPVGEPEEMLQGIVKLFQENPQWNRQDWIQNYTDLSRTACPVYLFKSGSNLEYGQLMRLIVEDPSVVVREYVFPLKANQDREFLITYTALIVLHQLGVDLQGFQSRIIIPRSVVIEAQRESDAILKINSRDIVASLGVRDEQVQFFQPTEKMINESTQKAVTFKQYVAKLTSVENTQDTVISGLSNISLTELVGICDYDALIIAHTRGAVLVTCEMMTAGLTLLDPVKSETVGIADFLCMMGLEVTTLLDTLKKMLHYRFRAAITPTVIQHVIEVYDAAKDEEKQTIERIWIEVLEVPGSLGDDHYLKAFTSACFETIQLLKMERLFSRHPIIYAFNWAVFRYNGGRIEWTIQEGKLYYRLIHGDPDHTIAE